MTVEADIPDTMQAVFLTGHGGPEVIEVGALPTPEVGPGEVLVAMRAASDESGDICRRARTVRARVCQKAVPKFGDGFALSFDPERA